MAEAADTAVKIFKKIMQKTKSATKDLLQNPLVPSPMMTFIYENVHHIVDYNEEKTNSSNADTSKTW